MIRTRVVVVVVVVVHTHMICNSSSPFELKTHAWEAHHHIREVVHTLHTPHHVPLTLTLTLDHFNRLRSSTTHQ